MAEKMTEILSKVRS